MRKFIKKVSAIAASALMVGLSMGTAMAASVKSDFTPTNTAIVVGSGASVLDTTAATVVQTYLGTSGGSASLGSESFQLSRTGDLFNLGDNAATIRGTLRKEQLPNFLADGVYHDEDSDEFEYTQKIDLNSNLALSHFRDSVLNNEPQVGIKLDSSNVNVLNYTLSFQTKPDFTADALEKTTLEILGKEYFILDVGDKKLTLLDSAASGSIAEGESTTLSIGGNSYTVNADILTSSGTTPRATLTINGQQFTINEGGSRKVPGTTDAYIGIKRVVAPSFAGQSSIVEFAIGSGKLVLTENLEVELNEQTVEGLYVGTMNASDYFSGITLEWRTEDKSFITPNKELVLPGFENIKLSMTEFYAPMEEEITVQDSGQYIELRVPLKSGDVTLPLLYHNDTGNVIKGIGESDDKLLVTSNTHYVEFNKTANHEWFVASWAGSTEAYSEVFRISSVNADNETTLVALGSGQTYSNVVDGGSIVAGDIELDIDVVDRTGGSNWVVNVTGGSDVYFRHIYSAEGMKIYLPYSVGKAVTTDKGDFSFNVTDSTSGNNATAWNLWLEEQNKEGTLGSGKNVSLTLAPTSATDDEAIHVSGVTAFGGTNHRVGTTDVYESYVVSDLATKVVWDKSGDEYTAKVYYNGEEAYGKVFVSSTDVTSSSGVGAVIVKDSEINTVGSKNIIVVGGSCINSVAANLLGSNYCGSDFTDATANLGTNSRVGSGQFLIKKYSSPYTTGKFALLVAGYEAADTTNAGTYLTTQDVDTSKTYRGTSATSADTVTTVSQ